jgi:uncharacterized protein (DUF2147 family)
VFPFVPGNLIQRSYAMKKIFMLSVCMVLLFALNADAADRQADAILGQWYTDGDESVVEIYKSGNMYAGKIVWIKEPLTEDGKKKTDQNNPDESKRNTEIVGLKIVWNFKNDGKNRWSGGSIYDPNKGKTYSSKAKLKGEKLHIRGFIGVAAFGRTTIWRRRK